MAARSVIKTSLLLLGLLTVSQSHTSVIDCYQHINPLDVVVVGVNDSKSDGSLGTFGVFDDYLTKEANASSEAVGRAHGFYVNVDSRKVHSSPNLMVTAAVDFENAEYSMIEVQGLYRSTLAVRQLTIVGGIGDLMNATGIACLNCLQWDNIT